MKDSWDISGGWTHQNENVPKSTYSCKVSQRDFNLGSKVIAPMALSQQISTSKTSLQPNSSLICLTHGWQSPMSVRIACALFYSSKTASLQVTLQGSCTKKLAELGLKYSSPIPNILPAPLSIRREKKHTTKTNPTSSSWQFNICGSTAPHQLSESATFAWKEEPDFQHSLGRELSDRKTEKALKETFHQQPLQMSELVSSSLHCLGCSPSPGAALSPAKSTCPAPSFNCHGFTGPI